MTVSSLKCFSELYWNHFSIILWKGWYRCLAAGKKLKIITTLLSIHNMIIITIYLFRQVIISVCSPEQKILLVAFVFDIKIPIATTFITLLIMTKIFLCCCYVQYAIIMTKRIDFHLTTTCTKPWSWPKIFIYISALRPLRPG